MVRRGREREQGMTLVEIMITLIISSIIAASTFMFFAGQQRVYETQTKVLNIQQSLWAAMEVVARYVRASGSGMYGCVIPASRPDAVPGVRLQNTFPSGNPLSPNLATASRPLAGIRAYDASTGGWQWIPPLWIVNNSSDAGVLANTDVVSVAFGSGTSGTDLDANLALNFLGSGSARVIQLGGTATDRIFQPGDFLLVLKQDWAYGADPQEHRGCTLLQFNAPSTTGTTTIAHNPNNWNPADDVSGLVPNNGYPNGTSGVRIFGQLTWVSFFVQMGANGIPNLMIQQRHSTGAAAQPQILAEGIEDLQVSFACDTGPIGAPNLAVLNGWLDEGSDDDSKRTDEWWNNVPSDTPPAINTPGYCNLPTAVRLTLVARSLVPDDLINPAATNNRPIDVEDHRYSSPQPDRYRRRVLNTTVYPRNNRPQ